MNETKSESLFMFYINKHQHSEEKNSLSKGKKEIILFLWSRSTRRHSLRFIRFLRIGENILHEFFYSFSLCLLLFRFSFSTSKSNKLVPVIWSFTLVFVMFPTVIHLCIVHTMQKKELYHLP